MAKTVEEIKAEKSEVEGKILKMLKDLEASSGMIIDYVDVRTDRHSYEERECTEGNSKTSLRKLKGVLDIMIQMNLGNDPDSMEVPTARG